MAIVDFQGVRNFSWTAPKKSWDTRPSRAIARKTRGPLSIMTSSTDVMPATPAVAMMPSAQPMPFCWKARLTGALMSIWSYLTIPVSTATTAMYSTVQMMSDATIPIGTSRFGFRASSVCVETESKPM